MKYLYLAYLLLISSWSFAQRQNVYFLKKDGRRVELKDSADFVRVVREPDSGSVLYNIMEFYPKGAQKMMGKSTKIDPVLSLEGICITYYENGKRKEVINYKKNHPFGEAYTFFPNGKLYTVEDYGPPDTIEHYQPGILKEPLIKTCMDSTGKVLVSEGNGRYLIYSSDFKWIDEEGDVKNGQRTGEWKGTSEKGKLQFTEVYDNGKLLKGTATDSVGTYRYTVRSINAQYKNGLAAFGRYLSTQITYPIADREMGMQGTVLLTFVISKNGTVKDIKVLRKVSPNIDAEAARVLAKSKDWLPGVYFGRQVSSQFTVPIAFTLSR
jgi:TonB family protein